MFFTAVENRQFFLIFNFETRYLKNGRSHKKNYIYSKSSKSGQKYIGTKKITIFYFYYPSQNFALWQKIALTQNFYPNFFYSLDPPLSEFKVKIRGHPFAYRCYSSNRTIKGKHKFHFKLPQSNTSTTNLLR